MRSRVLVTGAAGQLASVVVRALGASAEVVALTRAELDITDEAAVERVLAASQPGLIINCASDNDVDAALKIAGFDDEVAEDSDWTDGEPLVEVRSACDGILHQYGEENQREEGGKRHALWPSQPQGKAEAVSKPESLMAGERILDVEGEDANADPSGTTRRIRRNPGPEEEEVCDRKFGPQTEFRGETRIFGDVTCNKETPRRCVRQPRLKSPGDALPGFSRGGGIPVQGRRPELQTRDNLPEDPRVESGT